MAEQQIRIMVVDDHAVVRGGLAKFLTVHPDLHLVGEAESGEEAVLLAQRLRPDVVLMDLKMPGMDGVAATRLLREKCPGCRVIVLTSFAEDGMVQAMRELPELRDAMSLVWRILLLWLAVLALFVIGGWVS